MKVEFRKTGYHTAWGYKPELLILFSKGETKNSRMGRWTWLSLAIEKYIIKNDFLHSNQRSLCLDLDEQSLRLLNGLLACDTANWSLFKKAIEEEWNEERLGAKILWKVL